MLGATAAKLVRRDGRLIIHFDYDCFYASVFEAEDPALRSLPLAVQQKQIIVTCNYEARRRGLHKLQLVAEARKLCPDVIIVLGEDLTRFRDASKALYGFIRAYSWSDRAERLGFDEVWLDVTELVDHNEQFLNRNDLVHSFFHLSRDDPIPGFAFDAARAAGHTYPRHDADRRADSHPRLTRRLILASHLALHIRHRLEDEKGYTSTVGIATSRLISKLVGNLNKPKGQTTLLPPYASTPAAVGNIETFIDEHEIGAIPWVGFKSARAIREHVLQRRVEVNDGLIYGAPGTRVTVGQVRNHSGMSPSTLERLLAGPGSPHGIGAKIFALINGVDDSEVGQARDVPRQISIEDSYIRLDTLEQVVGELQSLTTRLVERMRMDLIDESGGHPDRARGEPTWPRTFKRISRSAALPSFAFNSATDAPVVAEKLVTESLLPLFRKLHPAKSGWNLSLVNVAVTNMVLAAGEGRAGYGQDITRMFREQDDTLGEFRVAVEDGHASGDDGDELAVRASGDGEPGEPSRLDETRPAALQSEGEADDDRWSFQCPQCRQRVLNFAHAAHLRFHNTSEI